MNLAVSHGMHIATLARITYRIIAYHDAAWGYHVHTALNQTWIRLISYMYHTCISIPLEVVWLGVGCVVCLEGAAYQ